MTNTETVSAAETGEFFYLNFLLYVFYFVLYIIYIL